MNNNYLKEYNDELKNVEINTKTIHFHNINREEIIFMYKNFYETHNLDSISKNDMLVDNLCLTNYEKWLVRFDDD